MANTFLAAQGVDAGGPASASTTWATPPARMKMASAQKAGGCELLLPVDVVTATEFKAGAVHKVQGLDAIAGPTNGASSTPSRRPPNACWPAMDAS